MLQAAELARNHDERLKDRSWFQVEQDLAVRHALEIRHESFVCEKFIRLLRQYGVGLVVADTVEWPLLMDVTSDFVYCRLHGSEQLYASGYGDDALDVWAGRVVPNPLHRLEGIPFTLVPDGEHTSLAVRQAASERLPETMLPDRFVLVADLPLTSSSKVDERRLLKEAGLSAPHAGASAAKPSNRPEVANTAILATNSM